jgi:hypothetical protein
MIFQKKVFVQKVMPKYLHATKFPSFTRKLSRWGFTRVPSGPEVGVYYHDMFQRDDPLLCLKIRCVPARGIESVCLTPSPQQLEQLVLNGVNERKKRRYSPYRMPRETRALGADAGHSSLLHSRSRSLGALRAAMAEVQPLQVDGFRLPAASASMDQLDPRNMNPTIRNTPSRRHHLSNVVPQLDDNLERAIMEEEARLSRLSSFLKGSNTRQTNPPAMELINQQHQQRLGADILAIRESMMTRTTHETSSYGSRSSATQYPLNQHNAGGALHSELRRNQEALDSSRILRSFSAGYNNTGVLPLSPAPTAALLTPREIHAREIEMIASSQRENLRSRQLQHLSNASPSTQELQRRRNRMFMMSQPNKMDSFSSSPPTFPHQHDLGRNRFL